MGHGVKREVSVQANGPIWGRWCYLIGNMRDPTFSTTKRGIPKDFSKFKEEFLDKYKGEVLHKYYSKNSEDYIVKTKNGYIYYETVGISGPGVQVRFYSNDEQEIANANDFLYDNLNSAPPKNTFFVLVRSASGFGLKSIGESEFPLERENYNADTIENYDHLISCLNSKDPCGRLSIIEGPPGTGKSYIIRALSDEVQGTFILVPSTLVGCLSNPEILPIFMDNKDTGLPIVLVVEDGDSALKRREEGDSTKLSEVLNLGDGLMGELCDIRMVFTTNAERVSLDPAVTRPGRLCRNMKVDLLDSHTASLVYKRLTGEKEKFSSNISLAEVYRLARKDGWTSNSKPKAIGNYV